MAAEGASFAAMRHAETRQKLIALVTLGSLGDLHPCLALGARLQQQGCRIRIVTTEFYRSRVEQLGFEFRALRPDLDPTSATLIGSCDDLKKGPEILFRQVILPHLQDTYIDLVRALEGVDCMLAGELVYAAPLAAEKLGLRWASMILSPCSFFSEDDPPVLVNAPWMRSLRKAGRLPYRTAMTLVRMATRHWWNPVRLLRRQEGLRQDCDPLLKDKFSPHRVLALFSSWLAEPQRDWPAQTIQTGFVFHEEQGAVLDSSLEVERFLQLHPRPLVFTLGSTAVGYPGAFFPTSIEASKRLHAAALLIGATRRPEWVSPSIFSVPYLPYAQIFPRASVIVHQGGSGTTGQALRAGRPMLFVPWGWDQPDNAQRAVRRGSALTIPKDRYNARLAADAMEQLRSEAGFAQQAAAAARQMELEPGLAAASAAVLEMLP